MVENTAIGAIDLLRFALASVWTECEKGNPSTEDIQQIADEALLRTLKYAKEKDMTSDDNGLEGWVRYRNISDFRGASSQNTDTISCQDDDA